MEEVLRCRTSRVWRQAPLIVMKNEEVGAKESRLTFVLREARPEPALPHGFRECVWRRIEQADLKAEREGDGVWLERLVTWLLRPRLAVAGAITALLLGGVVGVLNGAAEARQAAQDRYVTLVAPRVIR